VFFDFLGDGFFTDVFALFFCEPDFNVLFLWMGMPLTLLFSILWMSKNIDYIKSAMDGR